MNNQLLTTGEIAERTGYDRTSIHKKLDDLGISPVLTAGRVRLFDASVVERIGTKAEAAAARAEETA